MFRVRRTSEKQMVVYQQNMHADPNRYAHDCARIVQKTLLLLPTIAICANGLREQQLSGTIGEQPPTPRNLFHCPVCEGNGANPGIDPGVRAS